jgi:hypothetical protein
MSIALAEFTGASHAGQVGEVIRAVRAVFGG